MIEIQVVQDDISTKTYLPTVPRVGENIIVYDYNREKKIDGIIQSVQYFCSPNFTEITIRVK